MRCQCNGTNCCHEGQCYEEATVVLRISQFIGKCRHDQNGNVTPPHRTTAKHMCLKCAESHKRVLQFAADGVRGEHRPIIEIVRL